MESLYFTVSLTLILASISAGVGTGEGQLVGGFTKQDLVGLSQNDIKYYNDVGSKAVKLMKDNSERNYVSLKFSKILSLATQVVSGTVYNMHLEVLIDNEPVECHLMITHLYPWLEASNGDIWFMKAVKATDPCAYYTVKPIHPEASSLLGGMEDIGDGDKERVNKAAKWAVEHINGMSNSLYRQALLKISKVRKQIVDGVLYNFHLIMVSTSCINNAANKGKTLEECPPVSDQALGQDCEVSVVEKSGKLAMKDFNCIPNQKRDIVIGGDDHDSKPHRKSSNLIGRDSHDYIRHGRKLNGLLNRLDNMKSTNNVLHMNSLGSDDLLPQTNTRCSQYVDEFIQFKAKNERVYAHRREERVRFQIFCDNMEKVKEIRKNELGSAIYGATQFADLSEEEFSKKYLGLRPSLPTKQLASAKIPNGQIPESWDWRDHGAVTPVKTQGSCGSCWAFSTTGNIEGQYAIRNSSLLSLSEQELVDCDKLDLGCGGGLPSNAYEAIMKIGGLEKESDYKYDGYAQKCRFNKSAVAVRLSGAVNISKNEVEIAAWLYHNGPISIGINAFAMQFYFGGIAHPWKFFCNPKKLDHGVLIVGYGKEGNEPYWIVKNSWGASWGRQGYYYVYRGDGTCGLNTSCTSAVVV